MDLNPDSGEQKWCQRGGTRGMKAGEVGGDEAP